MNARRREWEESLARARAARGALAPHLIDARQWTQRYPWALPAMGLLAGVVGARLQPRSLSRNAVGDWLHLLRRLFAP